MEIIYRRTFYNRKWGRAMCDFPSGGKKRFRDILHLQVIDSEYFALTFLFEIIISTQIRSEMGNKAERCMIKDPATNKYKI